MQAIILAGGKGTRLAPYTTILPKPLMPVGEVPILELIIRQLQSFGFDQIEIATGYLSALISAYFGDGSRWGVKIRYHVESEPAGTAGPIYLLREVLDETFVIMNGDVLTDLDYGSLFRYHIEKDALLTIATCQRDITLSLGAIVKDEHGEISDYVEKPTYAFECSAGIYAANRRIVELLADKLPIDFPTLVRRLIADRAALQTFPIGGFWLDVGTPEDYRRAQDEFATRFAD